MELYLMYSFDPGFFFFFQYNGLEMHVNCCVYVDSLFLFIADSVP